MANKASGKKYVSKGTGIKGTKSSTLNAVRSKKNDGDKLMDKFISWKNGGDPWITIENPNKNDLGAKFIRVRYSETKHGKTYKEWEKINFSA